MKRLLLPLLAALALPTAVNASDYYLILQNLYEGGTYSVPMKTLEGCEAALEQAMGKNNWSLRGKIIDAVYRGICLKSEQNFG